MLRHLRHFFAIAVPVFLVLLFFAVLLCYVNRWDELVVVTLIPIWAWAGMGILVSIISWPILKSQYALITFVLWLVTGVALSDESAGLLREFRAVVTNEKPTPPTEEDHPDTLRVITLNCREGGNESTADLKTLHPDIVLLQNSPDRATLIDLTAELFESDGTFVRSDTCSILARGRLENTHTDETTGSLIATLELPGGGRIDVVNVSLPFAAPRFDIWKGDCWRELTERRKTNRRTLRNLLDALPDDRKSSRTLVGGSFGAPPSDDIYRLLRNAGLNDSFRQAGYGWGNTYPDRLPLMRIDQIWSSQPYFPEQSEVFAADTTDHRPVVSDFRESRGTELLARR